MAYAADREWDRRLGIQTTGREDERSLKFMPYEPTPYSVLLRLADSGLVGPGDRVLDYGCGKGRVAFFLAWRVGCHAVGIDRSEKLIAVAEENRASFAHPGRVRFLAESAERYRPVDENVFFFFNPFSGAVLDIALRRVLASLMERPRAARLLFYYPSDAYLARLASEPLLRWREEIDCRDLFDGDNPAERIVVYEY